MGIIQTLSSIAFNVGGVILILLILVRKGDSGGLSSAFGGVGGGDLLGVRAQKQLDKLITWVAGMFIVSAILLNTPAVRNYGKSGPLMNNETKQQQDTNKQNTEKKKEEEKK